MKGCQIWSKFRDLLVPSAIHHCWVALAAAGGIFREENDMEFLRVPNISWSHYSELLGKSQLTHQLGDKEELLAHKGKHRGDVWGGYVCGDIATLRLSSAAVLRYLESAAKCKDNFWNVQFLRILSNFIQVCCHIINVWVIRIITHC